MKLIAISHHKAGLHMYNDIQTPHRTPHSTSLIHICPYLCFFLAHSHLNLLFPLMVSKFYDQQPVTSVA